MWTLLAIGSALLLGVYDVAKKQALKKNGPFMVLFAATLLSTILLAPFFKAGTTADHLRLVVKAVLVAMAWISGMIGIKYLPLTTVSTIKGSRPVLVILFSMILFGERLNLVQWAGIALIFTAMVLLAHSTKKEGITISNNRGIICMVVSVLAGAASALYDKHIIRGADAIFVLCWSNFYVTAILGLIVLGLWIAGRGKGGDGRLAGEIAQNIHFRWDWMLPVVALLITTSDFLYFYALKQPGALLSVISMLRRCSIVVTFVLGAILFKEKGLRAKSVEMLLIVAGMALLVFCS